MLATGRYLDAWLGPLLPVLHRADVTDVFINRPGEVWIETISGKTERHEAPALDDVHLWRLARQIASLSHQGISRAHPLLSAKLPDGARVQIVAPPATRGAMAIAIRKHIVQDLTLADYLASGGFADTRLHHASEPGAAAWHPAGHAPDELAAILGEAVRARRNIVVSGGTSSGKTTLLNALMREIPADERLILIEDTPELRLSHANIVGFVAVKGDLGEASITSDDLLMAALRMRPDRIILGEIRGSEAFTFLRAINTGHPGSLTSIHADSAEGALDQLGLIAIQSGATISRAEVIAYADRAIDLIIQLERRNGLRRISEMRWR
eukprot:gene6029-6103_t